MSDDELDDGFDIGDDERARERIDEICERFVAAAEAAALTEHQRGWAPLLLGYAFDYEGTEAHMLARVDIEQVVDIFPRKVSCDPDAAPDIVTGLRAFLAFLDREIGLADAAGCRAVLDGDAATRLRARLADPRMWGMAKGFVMSGRRAGFEMKSDEDMRRWAAIQNTAIELPSSSLRRPTTTAARQARRQRKEKRRKQKASRRKNR